MRQMTLAGSLLLLLAAVPAAATTFVMMDDATLVDRADAVLTGTVEEVTRAGTGERPSTRYRVAVDRTLKGTAASEVLVDVLGGVAADGTALKIWGAPRFEEGARVLLFLSERGDGTYGIVQFLLGAFHRVEREGLPIAFRDLREAHRLDSATDGEESRGRHFERFADWIGDRADGSLRTPDYFVDLPAGTLMEIADAFALFTAEDICGRPLTIRWFRFDDGGSVPWHFHQSGYNTMGDGVPAFRTALQTWNDDPRTFVRYVYAGLTSASGGFTDNGDGRNTILFNDPNDEIDEGFQCGGGGVIAIGGPRFNCGNTGFYGGSEHYRTLEAEIVTENGTACLFTGNATIQAEVFAHELGHTLGIGHTNVRQALMFATVHNPSIGASLHADDRAAAAALYAPQSAGNPPATPSELTADAISTSEIELAWEDNAANEASFEIERRSDTGEFTEIASVGPNVTTYTDTGLPTANVFTYRVKASNSSGSSLYSNQVTASTFDVIAPCVPDDETLCLNGDRFRVQADWTRPTGESGPGRGVPLTSDTGYFWFFRDTNVEMVVKVLKGCGINGHYWVFAGGLTDVEVLLRVTDTTTGEVELYENPLEVPFQPIQDIDAFATCP